MSHYSGSAPATDWRTSASCAGPAFTGHRDDWFPTPGDHDTRDAAKAVCADCPARLACLADAMEEEGGRAAINRFGIRGGLTPKQRHGLYEKQRQRWKKAREAREIAA